MEHDKGLSFLLSEYSRKWIHGEGNMEEFKKYKRVSIAEMRPYIKGEDLSDVSISKTDDPESDMGMIARNPVNHKDQWYVAREYFQTNFEEI